MLLPISMVAINLEGFLVSNVNTFDKNPSCFFSISIWILLAEIKAISIPEKKAENSNETRMILMDASTVITDCLDFFFQIFGGSFF